ncbi:MAG: glycoside hydrolase family 97 protein [Tannerellaceae bacterium]|nr:glycoside hydrolase family 97 protein [Tannerellaceae bacterium]
MAYMRKWVNAFVILLFYCSVSSASEVVFDTVNELFSPDGNYCFRFYQKQDRRENKQMYYTLTYKGKEVIKESVLGVQVENHLSELALGIPLDEAPDWCSNLSFTGVDRNTTHEYWTPVYGERSWVKNHYNEMILHFQKGNIQEESMEGGYDRRKVYYLDLIVRAFDEGVAFCYYFPEALNGLFIHITEEQTRFHMPAGTMAWYERWAQGPYELLPLENWPDESERPLTLQLENGLYVALAEARMTDFVRTKFRLDATNSLQTSLYSSADIITPYAMPWRVIMVAEKPGGLIENNDIILNLNPSCEIENTHWIKPGKVIRVARVTQEDAKACVDFALERGLQYVHIDAGWYGPEMKMSSDATAIDPSKDLDLQELCTYASSRGIGVWVYVNQRALIQQLDEILPHYKEWGIKGIKFGFVQVGNQYWTKWLHEAVKKCAAYGIMVDIHDEYRPTGFSRTYPNLLTQEGIHGNEEMPDATHNAVLPFTRYLAGAGDYTVCYYNSRIKNTHAHQLALSVICYSPLQFLYWYDQPSAYRGEPEIEFFDKVPTVWDDTRVVDGKIGEYIVTARRSADEWFIGAITNTEARRIEVPTGFLEKGKKYTLHMYEDDEKIKTRTKVKVSKKQIKGGDTLKFDLQASGGVALHICP